MTAAGKIPALLDKVMRRENLTIDESAGSMAAIRSGDATAAQTTALRVGIAFFFAPPFRPSMRQAAPVRRELGVRTAFNLLGPLTDPAGATRQLIGVPQPELTELMARAVLLLGGDRAWIVHGADGIDEM